MTEPTPGKYSKGIHIKMMSDGKFERDIEMMRDVLPIIEELKEKWKLKLQDLTYEKDKISEEFIQREIEKRNLEEERRRLIELSEQVLSNGG